MGLNAYVNPLKCVSMSDQECKLGPSIMSVNIIESLFYPYNVLINKCSDRCSDINNPYANLCVLDVVKNMNIKVFNLISRTNKTRHVTSYETCACKYRLDASICNDKQRWNSDKCRCECKDLVDKGSYDDGFV